MKSLNILNYHCFCFASFAPRELPQGVWVKSREELIFWRLLHSKCLETNLLKIHIWSIIQDVWARTRSLPFQIEVINFTLTVLLSFSLLDMKITELNKIIYFSQSVSLFYSISFYWSTLALKLENRHFWISLNWGRNIKSIKNLWQINKIKSLSSLELSKPLFDLPN